MTTVICLDDYHSLDRKGRAEKGVTALAPEAQNFDLMAEQVGELGHCARVRVLCVCCVYVFLGEGGTVVIYTTYWSINHSRSSSWWVCC